MKTLEAKPFDQNAENWKRENRLFTSTVIEAGASGAKSNRYARTQKWSNSLIRFHCSNSCFLLETGIAGHEGLLLAKWHHQIREETAKTAVFRQRWQAWKVVRSIAAARQRPRTPRNWRCSFAFIESFLWQFNKKQHAEVIFRLSRPALCKNQENGSGKQWSLHAPLNFGSWPGRDRRNRSRNAAEGRCWTSVCAFSSEDSGAECRVTITIPYLARRKQVPQSAWSKKKRLMCKAEKKWKD